MITAIDTIETEETGAAVIHHRIAVGDNNNRRLRNGAVAVRAVATAEIADGKETVDEVVVAVSTHAIISNDESNQKHIIILGDIKVEATGCKIIGDMTTEIITIDGMVVAETTDGTTEVEVVAVIGIFAMATAHVQQAII